jgi:hypothetical protein
MVNEENSHLEEQLRQTLPPVQAPPEFRAHLKQTLMERHPRRGRRISPRGWLLSLTAVAAVLVIALFASVGLRPRAGTRVPGPLPSPSGGTPGPETTYGANLPELPPLTATGEATLGASAGPGFEVKLEYSRPANLPGLPESAPVYSYLPITVDPDTVKQVAGRLGLTGEVSTEPWQTGRTFQVGDPARAVVIGFSNGYYSYWRPLPDTLAGKAFPSEDVLVAAAREFLTKLVAVPETAVVRSVEIPTRDEASVPRAAYVTFAPSAIPRLISINPTVVIQVGADGQVYGGNWTWPETLKAETTYPVRPLDDAWQEVTAGLGVLAVDYRDLTAPQDNQPLRGSGLVTSANVGYVLTYAADGTLVVQPVAAFSGTAALDNGQSIPFTVYVKAVKQ